MSQTENLENTQTDDEDEEEIYDPWLEDWKKRRAEYYGYSSVEEMEKHAQEFHMELLRRMSLIPHKI